MDRQILKLMIVVLVLLSQISCEKPEQEKTITKNQVPQAVLDAFNRAYDSAIVKEYAEESKNGQKLYEVSCEFEGRKIDAIYNADGTVNAIEEVITVDQLPNTIHQAVAKEFPQFSLKLVEKIVEKGKTNYEVKLFDIKDQKNYELLFTDSGKLINKEVIKSRKDEE